jgi:predicted RNase H-like HicB family nuclease
MCHYRMVISYSETKQTYWGKVPELQECEAEGQTRAEVMAKLEEEMLARIENMKAQDIAVPAPMKEANFDGELKLKITPTLHQELAFWAKMENVELDHLLVELLSRGVSQRWGGSRAGHPRQENRGRRQEGSNPRYHDIMENRADFIEYVRQLDSGNRGGGNRGGRRGNR